MPRFDTRGFNKEKLIFVVVAALFSGGLYWFLTSAPIALVVEKPLTDRAKPEDLPEAFRFHQESAEYYVVDQYKPIHAVTGVSINRKRKTPFAPAEDYVQIKKENPVAVNPNTNTKAPPPPPPPPPPEPVANTKKSWEADDVESQYTFMGSVIMNGETFGLLKPVDESQPPRRVKVGDRIDEFNYTVTRIEKQAIHVKDGDQRPFILKSKTITGDEDSDEAEAAPSKSTKTKKASKTKAEESKAEKPKAEKPQPNPQVANRPEPSMRPNRGNTNNNNSTANTNNDDNDRNNRRNRRDRGDRGGRNRNNDEN